MRGRTCMREHHSGARRATWCDPPGFHGWRNASCEKPVGAVASTMLVDAGLGLGGLGLASGPTLVHLSHLSGRHVRRPDPTDLQAAGGRRAVATVVLMLACSVLFALSVELLVESR